MQFHRNVGALYRKASASDRLRLKSGVLAASTVDRAQGPVGMCVLGGQWPQRFGGLSCLNGLWKGGPAPLRPFRSVLGRTQGGHRVPEPLNPEHPGGGLPADGRAPGPISTRGRGGQGAGLIVGGLFRQTGRARRGAAAVSPRPSHVIPGPQGRRSGLRGWVGRAAQGQQGLEDDARGRIWRGESVRRPLTCTLGFLESPPIGTGLCCCPRWP